MCIRDRGMTYEDPNISPLEEMEDAYEVNDNMKLASEIVEKMEEETKPSNKMCIRDRYRNNE